jgi:MFS family permease
MILSPVWGSLSDSVGRKKIVIVGLLGFAVSLILFSFTISLGQRELLTGSLLFLLLVAARVLNGIFGSATRPSSGGWVADISSTESRSRAFARLDSGFSMGRILGPAVAGLLLLVSYTAPFFFFATGAFIVIIFVTFQKSPAQFSYKETINKLSIFDSRVWPFLVVSAGFGISNAALVQTSSFFFQDVITPSSDNYIALASIGFMLSALGVLNGQLLIADRLQTSPGSLVKLGVILNFLSLTGYAFSTSLVEVYICLFFYGLGGGMLGPGISSSLSLSVGKEYQGAAGGFLGMVIPIGHVISPLVSMPLYILSPSLPYLLGASLMFFAMIFIFINKRHKWIRDKNYREDRNLEVFENSQ